MRKPDLPQKASDERVWEYLESLTPAQRAKLRVMTAHRLRVMGYRQGEYREGSRTWMRAESDAVIGLLINGEDIDCVEVGDDLNVVVGTRA